MRTWSMCLMALLVPAVALAEAKFTEPPRAVRDGPSVKITFAVDSPCGVEVAIVDAKGDVVRHLAAGMLGGRKVAPPLGPGLKQTLVWDGKDDGGKQVEAQGRGPQPQRIAVGDPQPSLGLKVRVGLGMAARVEKHLASDPYTFRDIVALAVNAKGELFVLDTQSTYGASGMTVYDRDGKYVRTVMPYSASLPADRLASVGQLTLKGGARVPIVYNAHGQNLSPYTSGMKNQTMAFDPAGRLVLFSSVGTIVEHGPPRFLLFMDPAGGAPAGRDFVGPPLAKARGMLGGAGEGGTRYFDHVAPSPDGKFLYVSGGRWDRPKHVVCRIKPADKDLPKAWLGEAGKAGNDDSHFDNPQGVATDSAGRLYVADRGNDRVVVFSAEGRRVGSFPAPRPCQLFVHPVSGQIYLTSVTTDERGRGQSYKLLKFEAFKPGAEPKKLAELDGPGKGMPAAALDPAADPPKLWVASTAAFGQDLVPIVDRGDRLEAGKGLGRLAGVRQPMFIAADVPRGKLYVTEFNNRQRQIDLKTGAMKLFATGGEAAVDRDGFVYVVEGYQPVILNRYDAGGRPANFPGTDSHKTAPIETASKGPNVGFRGHVVAPDGDIYIIQMAFYGDGRVAVYGPDGKLKRDNVVVRMPNGSGGIAVDRAGSVFVSANVKPADQIYPPDFTGALPQRGWVWWRQPRPAPWDRTYYNAYLYHWASVFKFPPAGGEFFPGYEELIPGGSKAPHRMPMAIPPDATTYKLGYLNFDVGVRGALWQFHGYGPVPAAGLNWGDPSCVCMGARFCLDDYGRLYVPDVFRFAVNVLDPAGNLLARLGQYGNADDPGLSLAWGAYLSFSGGKLFVGDMANRRVNQVAVEPTRTVELPVP